MVIFTLSGVRLSAVVKVVESGLYLERSCLVSNPISGGSFKNSGCPDTVLDQRRFAVLIDLRKYPANP
jgi:hypothetical protein